jgi:hypothetical protein
LCEGWSAEAEAVAKAASESRHINGIAVETVEDLMWSEVGCMVEVWSL